MPTDRTRAQVRRRRAVALGVLVAIVAAVVLVVAGGGSNAPKRLVPGGGTASGTYDPLAFDADRQSELEQRASTGFADVVYEKSPGGVLATARRTARWRALVERSAKAYGVDPDTLEAVVFLESAGRPDVVAGGDLEGAVGLTQILASTATDLLGLHVDLTQSRKLTARIANARTAAKARKLERARRRADQRFDPKFALEAAARYLQTAQKKFGREDLAIATYHMGMGNLQTLLGRYGDDQPSYAQLYFDSAPLRHPAAYQLLSSLGDQSSAYYWKVRAARTIMSLYRNDRTKLARLEGLNDTDGPGARRLYPNGVPPTKTGARKPPAYLAKLGLRLTRETATDYAPDPATESALAYIGAGTRVISGQGPLVVETAHGIRIDIARRYRSKKQALAFQFVLDRMQAWNLIAWERVGNTLAIVVGQDAAKVLGAAPKLAADATRTQPK